MKILKKKAKLTEGFETQLQNERSQLKEDKTNLKETEMMQQKREN